MNEELSMVGDAPNSWADALQRQESERRMAEDAARAERSAGEANENMSFFNDLMQTHARLSEMQRQKNRRGAAGLLSAFKIGGSLGGSVPSDMLVGIGDALGFDGKTRALWNVSVAPNGDMVLNTARANPQGGDPIDEEPTKIPFKTVYRMALENPGILTRDELMRLRDNSITTQKITEDMANRDLPPVPENYGQVRTPVGQRAPQGGTSVNPNWLYGQQRRANVSAFGANGRGGFTNYDSNEETGHQLQVRDSGTRAADDKGRWKVLSRGADPNSDDGTQVTRYENDRTGEVVSVRDGETPPWESRAGSEKERIARINADGKIRAAEKANETKISLADAANALKRYGIDVSAQIKERGLDIQQRNADERATHNRATEGQQAENEKGRNERAKQANDAKVRLAEMKSGGTIGGRQPTAHEYVEVMKLAGDSLQSDETRSQARELGGLIADSLKKRGENVPEVKQGKAEVKTGDNGGDDNSPSDEYPGYSKGKAKRAIAAGWTWNGDLKKFEPPKK